MVNRGGMFDNLETEECGIYDGECNSCGENLPVIVAIYTAGSLARGRAITNRCGSCWAALPEGCSG